MLNKRLVVAFSIAMFGTLHGVGALSADLTPRETADLSSTQLNDQALESSRGGTLVLNDMKLDGIVSDNVAADIVTGSNIVTNGSFAGASGMPTLIQNTGNNVLIQNATIVNIQLQ